MIYRNWLIHRIKYSNYREIYPLQWGVPNCDPHDGENTKSCHCGEGPWIRGKKAWTGDLGKRMKDTYAEFYKTGSFKSETGNEIKSWREMEFNAFNVIDEDTWEQSSILNWSECNLVDQIHQDTNEYSWGFTVNKPNGI